MLIRIVLFSVLGGLLFGYDLSLIGPALPHIAADLGIGETKGGNGTSSGSGSGGSGGGGSGGGGGGGGGGNSGTLALELIVGASKAGAVLGTFIGGATMLRYGRRAASAINGVFFTLGPLTQALASGGGALALGRFVAGLGIGASAIVVPAYLAEVAPAARRGTVVQAYELAIALGTLLAVAADAGVAAAFGGWGGGGEGGGGGVPAWRWMLGLPALGGLAVAGGLLVLPESPRWLVLRGDLDQALSVLRRIMSSPPSSSAPSSSASAGSSSSASDHRRGVGGGVGGGGLGGGDKGDRDAARLAEAEDELLLLWSAVEKDKAAVLARRGLVLRARREARARRGSASPLPAPTRSGRLLDAWARQPDALPPPDAAHLPSLPSAVDPLPSPGTTPPLPPLPAAPAPPPPPAPGLERTFWHTLAHVVSDVAAVARGPEGHALAVAAGLAVFNQACASTAVINYAPAVLRRQGLLLPPSSAPAPGLPTPPPPPLAAAGLSASDATTPDAAAAAAAALAAASAASAAASVIYPAAMAAAKVVGVAASLPLVDRVGRRPLLVAGGACEAAALMVAAGGLWARSAPLFMAGVCLFLLAFSLSWAGLYWVVVSELFSMTTKSPATAAAAALLFASGTLADVVFLSAVDALGGWALAICALVAAGGAVFVFCALPETRGVPLAEVQAAMAARGGAARLARERRRAAACAKGGAFGRAARCLPGACYVFCCCWPAGTGGRVTALPPADDADADADAEQAGPPGRSGNSRNGGGGGPSAAGAAAAAAAALRTKEIEMAGLDGGAAMAMAGSGESELEGQRWDGGGLLAGGVGGDGNGGGGGGLLRLLSDAHVRSDGRQQQGHALTRTQQQSNDL